MYDDELMISSFYSDCPFLFFHFQYMYEVDIIFRFDFLAACFGLLKTNVASK